MCSVNVYTVTISAASDFLLQYAEIKIAKEYADSTNGKLSSVFHVYLSSLFPQRFYFLIYFNFNIEKKKPIKLLDTNLTKNTNL